MPIRQRVRLGQIGRGEFPDHRALRRLGAEMQVVQNGGETLLESGDVVAFSGMGAPLEAGGQPVIQVESVDAANSTAVAGVVYSRYNVAALAATAEALPAAITPEGAAAPGDFLLVVVRGPVQVKASALAGALALGIAFLTVSYHSLRAAMGSPVEALRSE